MLTLNSLVRPVVILPLVKKTYTLTILFLSKVRQTVGRRAMRVRMALPVHLITLMATFLPLQQLTTSTIVLVAVLG